MILYVKRTYVAFAVVFVTFLKYRTWCFLEYVSKITPLTLILDCPLIKKNQRKCTNRIITFACNKAQDGIVVFISLWYNAIFFSIREKKETHLAHQWVQKYQHKGDCDARLDTIMWWSIVKFYQEDHLISYFSNISVMNLVIHFN